MNEQRKTDSEKLKPLFDKSIGIFSNILDGKNNVTPQQLQVALNSTQIYTKTKAIENQRALLVYQVARDYSQDKEELRSILQNSISNVKFISNTTGRD